MYGNIFKNLTNCQPGKPVIWEADEDLQLLGKPVIWEADGDTADSDSWSEGPRIYLVCHADDMCHTV